MRSRPPQRVLVLGGGMVGSAVAMDLSRQWNGAVTVADERGDRLEPLAERYGVDTVRAELSQPDRVARLVADHDLVVGALPSAIGHQTLRAVIEHGRPIVDISFMQENALELDALAKDKGVTAVVDCGIAPGLSHMLAGFAASQLSPCERIEIYVGGLPVERLWPYEYKAGFSPSDVIEEYVRPARVVENGRVVLKEPLSGSELIDIPGVGILEAFVTDGLRTLTETLQVPFMTEKTLRYPGHAHLMRVFREGGFFSNELIAIGGQLVRPRDLTAALLFPRWTFREGEPDVTVLRVVVSGRSGRERVTYTWDVVDRYDAASRLRSMSRMTAFPAAIVAGLVADGLFEPGVHAPEALGRMGLQDVVLHELDRRGVRVAARVERQAD